MIKQQITSFMPATYLHGETSAIVYASSRSL